MMVTKEIVEKTKREQEAGRRALMDALYRSVMIEHVEKLNKRFKHAIKSQMLAEADGVFKVILRVHCADGKDMHFDEPFDGFPSDMMITQLALVCE